MSIGIGERLREARESRDLTREAVAEAMRVRVAHVRALEEEDFASFGGDVYAKGFLSTYARYLDLDPQPLLEEYRRYVQADDGYDAAAIATSNEPRGPRTPPPRWLAWGLVTAGVLIGAVGLANTLGGRSPAPADEPTETAAPSPTPTAAVTTEATPSPSPTPAPTFDGVTVELAFTGTSWAHLEQDGEVVLERVVEAGETFTLEGEESAFVWLGNAGAVEITFNGEDQGTLGGAGEVVRVTFTPDGPENA